MPYHGTESRPPMGCPGACGRAQACVAGTPILDFAVVRDAPCPAPRRREAKKEKRNKKPGQGPEAAGRTGGG